MTQSTPPSVHEPVLLQEVLETLDPQPGDVVLDATVNGGGHSAALCHAIGREGTLVGIDADIEVLRETVERMRHKSCRSLFREANFRNLDQVLDGEGLSKVSKVLFDLGLSSEQLARSGRGFTFQKDEPLLMTYSPTGSGSTFTARDILNTWSEDHLTDILRGYGEEPFARRIAQEIVKRREHEPIEYTTELVAIVMNATPHWYHRRKIHPATKTFQALRMTVNDELNALREALEKSFAYLSDNGRIAVISFHSIEDRVVKRTFREWVRAGTGTLITPKPLTPSKEETVTNPRARSAKLRVIAKLSSPHL